MQCRVIIDGVAYKKSIELTEAEVFNKKIIGTVIIASQLLGYANIIESVIRTIDGADIHLTRIYLQGAMN